MGTEKIFGILATHTIELPYETPEAQAEADKMNREIAGLGRVFRGATDWAFRKYEDGIAHLRAQGKRPTRREEATPLKSGDLVKIFKTVTDGDVFWQGSVDYDRKKYHHGLQKGLTPQKWVDMFYDALPAKLERDGKVMFGALEPFSETGTEGEIWSLHEYGKSGYDGLVPLQEGDKLTVYDNVRDGEVEWEGALDFAPEKITKLGWTEIMREARHMDTQKWLEMSYQNRPVVVTPAPKQP